MIDSPRPHTMPFQNNHLQTNRNQQAGSDKKLSQVDAEEVKRLNFTVDRILKAVSERSYILSIETEDPYPSARDPTAWCRNLPFDPKEFNMQYMSFLLPDIDTIISAKTEVDIERERRQREAKLNGTPVMGATIVQTTAKKKISWDAYKNRQEQAKNGVKGATDKADKPVDSKKEDGSTIDNGTKAHAEEAKAKVWPAKPATVEVEKKRALDHDENSKDSPKPSGTQQPPAKKTKLSEAMPSAPPAKDSTPKISLDLPQKLSPPRMNGLPPKLAPPRDNLPPKLSPPRLDTNNGLPPMLTCKLPDKIEEELDRRKAAGSTPSSAEKPRPAAQPMPEKAALAVPPSSQPPGSAGSTPKFTAKVRNVDAEDDPPKPVEKESLIVKLKFKKATVAKLQQLLKLPPNRKRQELAVKKTEERHAQKGVARKTVDLGPEKKAPAKRAREDEDTASSTDSSNKRAKLPAPAAEQEKPRSLARAMATAKQEKVPRTPSQSSIPSPSPSARSSAQKPQGQLLTPRKDVVKDSLKPTAMTRTASAESLGDTPGRDTHTPSGSKTLPPTSAPSANLAAAAWAAYMKKMLDLGRKLKHEARDLLQTGVKARTNEHRRATVVNVECVLAFMLAYIASDYQRHSDKKPGFPDQWKQLGAMWKGLRGLCSDYPHLSAIMFHLGAVISSRIQTLNAECGIPKDSPNPGALAGTLQTSFEHWFELQRMTSEALTRLPIEDLIQAYPQTWKGRGKGQRIGHWEKISPVDLNGPYFLPFGPDTTPIQAVRFGVGFLSEWMRKEGVEYELKVKI